MAKKTSAAPKAATPAALPVQAATPASAPKRSGKVPVRPKAKTVGANGASIIAEKPVPAKLPAALKNGSSKTPKRATKAAAVKVVKTKPSRVTTEQIALQAYFISEKRRNAGIPGDPHQDWLEAERQLKAKR